MEISKKVGGCQIIGIAVQFDSYLIESIVEDNHERYKTPRARPLNVVGCDLPVLFSGEFLS
jgi:hypothetical protein